MPQVRRKNRPQVRTMETQAKILDAAEAVFSEEGFEKTQLEEIAARAGFTRGAIYAHYSSKENLFLALMEQRVLTRFTSIRQLLEAEPEISKRPGLLRRWIVSQANDQSWSLLILEFKLYALRRPESREKLKHLNELLSKASGKDFIGLLFGDDLGKTARAAIEGRLTILGAVLSAVLLESHFQPKRLPKPQLLSVLDELCEALIHA